MEKLTVLLVGGGGREHALAKKISESPRLGKLYIAPGNPGTATLGENVPIKATALDELALFAEQNNVNLTIVGPDDPLAEGIVDVFKARGLRIFGPEKSAAKLESSKAFAKDFMNAHAIPTASFQIFNEYEKARAYIETQIFPLVVKASGLALGKGVFICATLEEADEALKKIMIDQAFGEAGSQVVIEEYLDGMEISTHAFCDGRTFRMFPTSQDHKRALDDDQGENTGGMGTIAPLPFVSDAEIEIVAESVVRPVLAGMKEVGAPYTGVLYPGLMMTTRGPRVLEFNARFGDPETQVYMRLLKTDILDIVDACIDGTLSELDIEWYPGFAACLVLASGGYPGKYAKGKKITGISKAEALPEVVVFHAGTSMEKGKLVTSGGRVLGVSAVADTLEEALARAYQAAALIHFDDMYYRRDIGKRALGVGGGERSGL